MQALSDDTLDAIVEHATHMPALGGMVELRALGGAMARVPRDATAFGHRDKRFLVNIIGAAHDIVDAPVQQVWSERLWQRLRAEVDGVYVNFLADEGVARVREAYPAATYQRLAHIKRQYDPTNLFRLNQNVTPSAA